MAALCHRTCPEQKNSLAQAPGQPWGLLAMPGMIANKIADSWSLGKETHAVTESKKWLLRLGESQGREDGRRQRPYRWKE